MSSKHADVRTPDLKDAESGSDADVTPAVNTNNHEGDTPAHVETADANQLDDNVDDLGNKAGVESSSNP